MVSHELAIRKSYSHLLVQLGLKDLPNLTHIIVNRPQFLIACWSEASLSSSSVGCSTGQLTRWKLASPRASDPKRKGRGEEGEKGRGVGRENPRQKSQFFYDLTLERTSQHFCHILYIRCQSLKPVHTQGGGWGWLTFTFWK